MSSILLLFELIILFFTSQIIISSLFFLFLRIFRSKKVSMVLVSIVFFPGVVVHELSHLLTAGILFVPVREMEFFPEFEDDGLKLGSVQIVRTDFLRRFLIGVAPLIVGGIFVTILVFTLFQGGYSEGLNIWQKVFLYGITTYFIFVISNTMFSSKKDIEGGLGIVVLFLCVLVGIVLVKPSILSQAFSFLVLPNVSQFLHVIVILFLPSCIINLLLTGAFFVLRKKRREYSN